MKNNITYTAFAGLVAVTVVCGTHTQYAFANEAEPSTVEQSTVKDTLSAGTKVVKIANLNIAEVAGWDAEKIKKLVPELNKAEVNIAKLSREIVLANDTKALHLAAFFTPADDGEYNLTISTEKLKPDQFALSVNNTGNQYTGDWRTSLSYIDRNLSGNADTLAASVTSSPGHWKDVTQYSLMYKFLMPKIGDTAYVYASKSNTDMGNIAPYSGLNIHSEGKAYSMGAHYQKNMLYTERRKKIIDFGFDYKSYDNLTTYDLGGGIKLPLKNEFNVKEVSVTYVDTHQQANQYLGWQLGYKTNFGGNKEKYGNYRYGSSAKYHILTAGASYQARMKGDWLVAIRGTGQFTNNILVTTEQLGAGGNGTVRGFSERAANGDKGYVASFEIYSPPIGPNQRLVLFTDYARLLNNKPQPYELKNDYVGSYGLGYRLMDEKNHINLSVDYAHVYKDITGANGKNRKYWNMQLSMSM